MTCYLNEQVCWKQCRQCLDCRLGAESAKRDREREEEAGVRCEGAATVEVEAEHIAHMLKKAGRMS